MSETILLTGATGFLGSHLLKSLLFNTNYNIIVLKRSFSNTIRIINELKNNRVIAYNIDKKNIDSIFKENKIFAIIHCATHYGRENNNSFDVLNTNLMFPISILDAAISNKVKYFINTDSYFNKENLSYNYLLNYVLSKKSLLLWLKAFSKKIQVSNLILEHVYGKNDNDEKFVSKMIDSIAIKKIDQINLTHGDQKRDFIHVDDVCNAYICILKYMQKHKWRYRNFEIGTGIPISIKDFVQEIKTISKSNTILNFGYIPYREDEIMISCADTTELRNTGFKCKYNYKTGLSQILGENNVQ